jgi:hypothetical protein
MRGPIKRPPAPANDEKGWRPYNAQLTCSLCKSETFRVLVGEADNLNYLVCAGCDVDFTKEFYGETS